MKILKVIRFNYKIILSFVAMVSLFSFLFSFSFAKSDDEIELPIIMYHSLLKSQKSTYIVHPNIFEEDLKYIQSKGYSTITMTELINYVYNDAPLPEKPIIITFDDGYYNNLSYAVPLLHKYNMKAVISIVGEYSDRYTESDEANPNYGYLRWKDINELIILLIICSLLESNALKGIGKLLLDIHTVFILKISLRKGFLIFSLILIPLES